MPAAQAKEDSKQKDLKPKESKPQLEEVKKRSVAAMPARMKPAEYTRTSFLIILEKGHVKEDFMKPSYWAHVAASLKPRDRVELHAEDGSFYAEVLIVSCDRTWATVQLLAYHDLTKVSIELSEEIMADYKVDFRGPKGWSVIRKSDNAVLQEKMHDKEDAKSWLTIHLKSNRSAE